MKQTSEVVRAMTEAERQAGEEFQWATSMALLTGRPLIEMQQRIRRIHHDARLANKMAEVEAELGGTALVTNVEWSGPTMTDMTVSVAPNPASWLRKGRAAGMTTATSPKVLREMYASHTLNEARAVMRARVAWTELRNLFFRTQVAMTALRVGCGGSFERAVEETGPSS